MTAVAEATRELAELRTFPELVQGSDEWHDQRRGMVTASVVGQLITARRMTAAEYQCPSCEAPANAQCRSKVRRGAEIKQPHPERTKLASQLRRQSPLVLETATGDDALGLTALLAAERVTGYTDPTYMSSDMWRGVEDEPRAVDAYSGHFAPVTLCGFIVRRWGRCQLGYSPDGLVGDDGLIEVKSRRQKKQLLTVVSGEAPAENMAQLQAGLFVSGRAWIDYISYSGGMHLWTVRVTPDPRWFDAIVAAVEAFENTAADMVTAYQAAVEGLPLTDRPATEMVI